MKTAHDIPLVDLRSQYESIREEMDSAIRRTIEGTKFLMGPETKAFEKDFAKFCEARRCISMSNGTSALEVALRALGVGPGDEVITVPNTFIATIEAILMVGAKPVFVDVDDETFTMDPELLKGAITEKTQAIMPVDLYGQPCDLGSIMEIARKKGIFVVDDACQAHGAQFGHRRLGGVADATAFSFYPGKNLGAYGDAGALTTDNEEIADAAESFRDHGRKKGEKYRHDFIGTNYRMDEIQSAVLNVKMRHLEKWTEKRRALADEYRKRITSSTVRLPTEAKGRKHVYHLFVIRSKQRDALNSHLKAHGISCGIHYPLPLHLQPALQHLSYKEGDFPVTEALSREILSLPLYPELTPDQLAHIADTINAFRG